MFVSTVKPQLYHTISVTSVVAYMPRAKMVVLSNPGRVDVFFHEAAMCKELL